MDVFWKTIASAIPSFLGALLGSGVIVAFIEWVRLIERDRAKKRAEFVYEQVTKLYGPLHFLVRQNAEILKIRESIEEQANDAFSGSMPSVEDRSHGERHTKQLLQTIETNNEFLDLVMANNHRMKRLIERRYWLIQPEDQELFHDFVLAVMRAELDFNKDGCKLPPSIARTKPPVPPIVEEFNKAVESQYRDRTYWLTYYRTSWLRNVLASLRRSHEDSNDGSPTRTRTA